MSRAVLDASAILAVLHRETGYENVVPYLRQGLISAVNFSEVLKKMLERGADLNATQNFLSALNLSIIPFDEDHAIKAAEIWPQCRPFGLSAADRACLAAGILKKALVVTADERMQDVEIGVQFKLIRKRKKEAKT